VESVPRQQKRSPICIRIFKRGVLGFTFILFPQEDEVGYDLMLVESVSVFGLTQLGKAS
jgi:hypothetical protein